MSWELYEVWTEDYDGHQELVHTTKSLKEAHAVAEKALTEDETFSVIVYLELDGETTLIKELFKEDTA
jgi:hypothetical protein